MAQPGEINFYELLEHVLRVQGSLNLIQVGAFVGGTPNDPVCRFVKHYCGPSSPMPGRCTAVLIEPIRHVYHKLLQSYADCTGPVRFENVAVGNRFEVRDFYRLRENADPRRDGFPDYFRQLGSLLPDRVTTLWDSYEQRQFGENQAAKRYLAENTVVEKVFVVTLADIVAKHELQRVDLLQIDAEGFDYEIIKTIDFRALRPGLINYERVLLGLQLQACRDLLQSNSYVLADHDIDTLAFDRNRLEAWKIALNLVQK